MTEGGENCQFLDDVICERPHKVAKHTVIKKIAQYLFADLIDVDNIFLHIKYNLQPLTLGIRRGRYTKMISQVSVMDIIGSNNWNKLKEATIFDYIY